MIQCGRGVTSSITHLNLFSPQRPFLCISLTAVHCCTNILVCHCLSLALSSTLPGSKMGGNTGLVIIAACIYIYMYIYMVALLPAVSPFANCVALFIYLARLFTCLLRTAGQSVSHPMMCPYTYMRGLQLHRKYTSSCICECRNTEMPHVKQACRGQNICITFIHCDNSAL